MAGRGIGRPRQRGAASMLLLATCSALSACGPDAQAGAYLADAADPVTKPEVVPYRVVDGQELSFDVYPSAEPRPGPALIFVHGGGWMKGIKDRVPPEIQALASAVGATLVSVDYRLVPTARYPAQIEDCTRAVQVVRHEAPRLGIDASRMALIGISAGSLLTLWVGLHDDLARPDSCDPVERESTRVAAIVNFYGPTDLRLLGHLPHRDEDFRGLFELEPEESYDTLPAGTLEAASPLVHVSSDDPPVLTCHGTADPTVPFAHADALHRALQSKGVESHLFPIEGARHGWPWGRTPFDEVRDFLRRHLGLERS